MIHKIKKELHHTEARLVAVSKTKPNEQILRIYDEGQRVFGENHALEMKAKHEALPKDIEWHFIGHLQRNKIKYIIPFVKMIHAVDSMKLLKEIDKRAGQANRVVDCLLQLKIATEESKHGFDMTTLCEVLHTADFQNLKHIRVCGVMGMASFVADENEVMQEFQQLKSYFDKLKQDFFPEQPTFKEISMGMSGDYQLALKAGSTLVRIGSLIFGGR